MTPSSYTSTYLIHTGDLLAVIAHFLNWVYPGMVLLDMSLLGQVLCPIMPFTLEGFLDRMGPSKSICSIDMTHVRELLRHLVIDKRY